MLQSANRAQNREERIASEVQRLEGLVFDLIQAESLSDQEKLLDKIDGVKTFLSSSSDLAAFLKVATLEERLLIKAIAAIDQGPIVFRQIRSPEKLRDFLALMAPIEQFYGTLGGIVGYQLTVLRLLQGAELGPFGEDVEVRYSEPSLVDLREAGAQVNARVMASLEHLDELADLFVVGGAGDRLNLLDRKTGQALPAARLEFGGRSLLEGLVRDVVAREYLRYKFFGKQSATPIVMMTSEEKDNHQHIVAICEEARWFGRPRERFFMVKQPMVPVITVEGNWSMKGALEPMLKPGGHGAVWKLSQDQGALSWLNENSSAKKLLVRQINNPIAGTDTGLLAFVGIGLAENYSFGFCSCARRVGSAEGMNVALEAYKDGVWSRRITNVEYTELDKRGIEDVPSEVGGEFSAFSCNTNILFADVAAVEKALQETPTPGLIINLKKTAPFIDETGVRREERAGRLESTMQNIADYIVDEPGRAVTYCTYGERSKTHAVTKNAFKCGEVVLGTPESTFHLVQKNYRDLLTSRCGWQMPEIVDLEETLDSAPPFLVHMHPALGPLYDVVASKLRRGSMAQGSELTLEIADVDLEDLVIDGSLQVEAKQVVGHPDSENGGTQYSENTGKLSLHRVRVENRGVDAAASKPWWRYDLMRQESLKIILQGDGEFHAEDVTFTGDMHIEVKAGERVVARQGACGEVVLERHGIPAPTWSWEYIYDAKAGVISAIVQKAMTS